MDRTASSVSGRFAHVDALRALSVAIVVLAHAGAQAVPGGSGVTMFFAISGFVITYQLIRERERTNGFDACGFYLRRLAKLAPVFILLIILPSMIYATREDLNIPGFLSQVFFSYNWFALYGDSKQVLPGSGIVWSLAIEEQFYILFAVVWLFVAGRENWLKYLTVLTVAAIAIPFALRLLIADGTASSTDRIYYGTDTRLDGIAWGILAAIVFHLWQDNRSSIGWSERFLGSDGVLVFIGVLWVGTLAVRDEYFRDTFRYTIQSIVASAFILYGLASGKGPLRGLFHRLTSVRIVLLVGLASYSIYLAHNLVFHASSHLLDNGHLKIGILAFVGSAIGSLLYVYFERPINDRLRAIIRRQRSTVTTVTRRASEAN